MLFKIGDTIYDPNEIPCAVIFADNEEKKTVCDIILADPNIVHDTPDFWFSNHPKDHFTREEFIEWATLTPEQRESMTAIRK